MAQAMLCDGCSNEPALIIVQNIQEAEVMALCPACVTGWTVAWLQTLAPEMLAPPPAKPARKSRPKAAATVADDGPSGDGQAEGAERAEG